MGDRPTLLLLLLEPIPLHYHPSYHRCLLHLLLSFLPRSAFPLWLGVQLCRPHFRTASLLPLNRTASSSYLSFLPPPIHLSLSLFVRSTKSSFARLHSSFSSSGYPPCPLILPPVIFLVSLLLFFFSFFSFCKSSLSFFLFFFSRLFIYAAFSRYYTHLVAFLTSFCLFPRIMCSLCARTNYDLFYFSSYCLRWCSAVVIALTRGVIARKEDCCRFDKLSFPFFLFFFLFLFFFEEHHPRYSRCESGRTIERMVRTENF